MRDFGLVMKMGPISAVQVDSPAAAAGLQVGDVIETVDGKPAGEAGGWTPDTLPDLMRQAAEEKREVEFVVSRSTKDGGFAGACHAESDAARADDVLLGRSAGGAARRRGLGIAYRVTNEVQSVVPGGPAAAAGIKAGDKITARRQSRFPRDKDGKTPKPLKLDLEDDSASWTGARRVDAVFAAGNWN